MTAFLKFCAIGVLCLVSLCLTMWFAFVAPDAAYSCGALFGISAWLINHAVWEH